MAFLRTFEKEVNREMGLWLVQFLLSPFLYTGLTKENFSLSGNIPDEIILLQI